jgi:putative endonuclease
VAQAFQPVANRSARSALSEILRLRLRMTFKSLTALNHAHPGGHSGTTGWKACPYSFYICCGRNTVIVIPNEAGWSWEGAGEGSPRSDSVCRVGSVLATYYVYKITNRTRQRYIGVINGLRRRVSEHKHRLIPGFTSKYFLERLVYCEETDDVGAAFARETELKGWRRSKKIAVIQKVSPMVRPEP